MPCGKLIREMTSCRSCHSIADLCELGCIGILTHTCCAAPRSGRTARQQEQNKAAQQRYRARKKQKAVQMESQVVNMQQQMAELQQVMRHNVSLQVAFLQDLGHSNGVISFLI